MRSLALVCLFFSLCFAKDVTLVQNRELSPQSFGLPLGAIMTWTKAEDPDPDVWIECDGREIDPVKFPKLRAMASHTPNYLERFLRGAEDGQTGIQKEDQRASYSHFITSHGNTLIIFYNNVKPIQKTLLNNYDFTNMLFFDENVSKDIVDIGVETPLILNTDNIQNYYNIPYNNFGYNRRKILFPEIINNIKYASDAQDYYNSFKKDEKSHYFMIEDTIVNGNSDETAPQHVYVRYFIKAI